MRTRADMTLPGLAGAFVVTAVLIAVWAAQDSSAGTEAPPLAREKPTHELYSARSHRAPVTRTAVPVSRQPTGRARSPAEPATP